MNILSTDYTNTACTLYFKELLMFFPWFRFIVLLKQEQGPKFLDDDSFSKHRG